MAMSKKRLNAVAFISILVTSIALGTLGIQVSNADASALSVQEKALSFLTDVYGLDLTKYAVKVGEVFNPFASGFPLFYPKIGLHFFEVYFCRS